MNEDTKINAVILMAGEGKRVKKSEHSMPKPLINIAGHPMFYYATRSIQKILPGCEISFVTLRKHSEKYNICDTIYKFFPKAQIHLIDKVLNGPVLSAIEGLKIIDNNNPIVFCDCDLTFLINDFDVKIKEFFNEGFDAMLLSFYSHNPEYSYIEYDENNLCKRIVEKKVISDQAVCGGYFFKDIEIFHNYASKVIRTNSHECYMSNVIEKMIMDNKKVYVCSVDVHLSFGTSEEIDFLDKEKLSLIIN